MITKPPSVGSILYQVTKLCDILTVQVTEYVEAKGCCYIYTSLVHPLNEHGHCHHKSLIIYYDTTPVDFVTENDTYRNKKDAILAAMKKNADKIEAAQYKLNHHLEVQKELQTMLDN